MQMFLQNIIKYFVEFNDKNKITRQNIIKCCKMQKYINQTVYIITICPYIKETKYIKQKNNYIMLGRCLTSLALVRT